MKTAYRVIAGVHHHTEPGSKKEIVYGKGQPDGDIVVTELNLMAAFPNKFVKVDTPASPPSAPAAPAPAPTPQSTPQTSVSRAESAETGGSETPGDAKPGVDVTAQFPKARRAGFLVFKRTDGYFVADRDNPTRFANKKPLVKGDVDAYVAELA